MTTIRLLTWNIRQGGSAKRMGRIIDSLATHDVDVIVLTEFWSGKGEVIEGGLRERGWTYQLSSSPPAREHGILLASQLPFEPGAIEACVPHRALGVRLPGFTLLGLHVPDFPGKWDKPRFWQDVLRYGRELQEQPALLLGDFNTGLGIDAEGTPFHCQEQMKELLDLGWIDAWRSLHPGVREFTWRSRTGNGFRLDYAYISPVLSPRLISAEHSHCEREERVSDHSALVVEIDC